MRLFILRNGYEAKNCCNCRVLGVWARVRRLDLVDLETRSELFSKGGHLVARSGNSCPQIGHHLAHHPTICNVLEGSGGISEGVWRV